MKKLSLSLLSIFLLAMHAIAQTPSYTFRSIDINPTGSSTPYSYKVMLDKIIFTAVGSTATGGEPWISDGTTSGTAIIKDIKPGSPTSGPLYFTEHNGKVYFTAYDNLTDYEPWITDGTTAGTQKLKEINATGASYPTGYKSYDGKVYFGANDGINGAELWVTDGTTAGTVMLKDINPGRDSSSPYPAGGCVFRELLYFVADDGVHGRELWRTDGTAANTVMIKDIYPGLKGSIANSPLLVYNNGIYFIATDSVHGYELWTSDGTAAGTHLVKDINPGTANSTTTLIMSLEYNGKLYFNAHNTAYGIELWSTDGTSAGTTVLDIVPGKAGSSPYAFLVYKNKMILRVTDSAHGEETWISDGTIAGTYILKDISPGYTDSYPGNFINYKGTVFFTANYFSDVQLYTIDTNLLGIKKILPFTTANKSALSAGSHFGNELIYYPKDSCLYFSANYNKIGNELWCLKDTLLPPPPAAISIATINNSNITLSPNPANHNFTIKTITTFRAGSVTLTDATGRIVKTEKLYNNEQTISLLGIAPGMYIADVWLDDKRTTQKLIIQ